MTNHTHVLWCIYQEPEIRLRDVAERVAITAPLSQTQTKSATCIQLPLLIGLSAMR